MALGRSNVSIFRGSAHEGEWKCEWVTFASRGKGSSVDPLNSSADVAVACRQCRSGSTRDERPRCSGPTAR